MDNSGDLPASVVAMSDETFERFSSFIHEELGIKMGPNKQTMLQSRLMKRLRALRIPSYDLYYDYLFSPEGFKDELPLFIHQVTTNKTDFFREPAHYDYLVEQALPTLEREFGCGTRRPLKLWSSACSTGEEPYTLAMVLSEYAASRPGFSFNILATDVSTNVLDVAVRGIYDEERVEPVPMDLRKKYLLRSRERGRRLVRIIPELRGKVQFQWVNLKAPLAAVTEPVDVIFCRNVIIYFDRPTQQTVLGSLCERLKAGGYLFMGHSETLGGLSLPLRQVALTVYRRL